MSDKINQILKIIGEIFKEIERISFDERMLLGSFICEDDKIYSFRNWTQGKRVTIKEQINSCTLDKLMRFEKLLTIKEQINSCTLDKLMRFEKLSERFKETLLGSFFFRKEEKMLDLMNSKEATIINFRTSDKPRN